ncbi:MAG: hypothetical protein ACJ8GN_15175, partial [Longimicrobiaceae bacterium]
TFRGTTGVILRPGHTGPGVSAADGRAVRIWPRNAQEPAAEARMIAASTPALVDAWLFLRGIDE